MGRWCRLHFSAALTALAIALAGHARAEEPAAVDGTPLQASAPLPEWSVRFSGGAGLAKLAEETDLAVGVRGGVDTEYWFSKHFGIGGEFGAAAFASVEWGGGDSATVTWLALAPAISVRGSRGGSVPMLSLAGGAMRAHLHYQTYCDASCTSSTLAYSAWGAYASLTGAATMDVGGDVELGGFIRVEGAALFLHPHPTIIQGFGALTFGMTLGFDVPGATTPGDSRAHRSVPQGFF